MGRRSVPLHSPHCPSRQCAFENNHRQAVKEIVLKESVVRGEIAFDPVVPDLAQAMIYIRLQDTSMADGLATTVVEQVLASPAALVRDDGCIPFRIEIPRLDPRRRYSIGVQVNVHGGGGTRIKAGDYINMESYPVLTRGQLDRVRVYVRRV